MSRGYGEDNDIRGCVCTRTGKPVFNLTCPSWTSHHSGQGANGQLLDGRKGLHAGRGLVPPFVCM